MNSSKTSVRIITLGCSKNRVDTEHLIAQIEGVCDVQDETYSGHCDYLVFNTCGFIGDAKQESIDAILEGVSLKERGVAGKIVVFGCLSQRYGKDLPSLIPEVDAWFGARTLDPLVRFFGAIPDETVSLRRVPQKTAYAYLKISEGCDRRCSYCAIPFIRGAHRSIPVEQLCLEAQLLANQGVKELVLIAQDTTYYGLDLYGKRSLAALIRALSGIDGIEWIRIHYSYPADFPEDVLEEMANNPKVCKYLDIPLQHISNTVLSNMRRHVTSEWTRNLISRLRDKVPGVVLRTTMIVGHPGEGDKEFGELLDFVREASFERLGAFTYSEEEGTYGAGHLKDSIPSELKQERYDTLMREQSLISRSFNDSRVGSVERVLVDDLVDGTLICRSQYESPEVDGEILVDSDDVSLVGSFIDVRIVSADDYDLRAELIGQRA